MVKIKVLLARYIKKSVSTIKSHPVGIDGQNHIIAHTPLKFLPPKEFKKRQKSIDPDMKLAIMSSIPNTATEVIEKKIKAS